MAAMAHEFQILTAARAGAMLARDGSAHGADNILLADDLDADHDIRLAIDDLREGTRSFRKWRAVNEAEAKATANIHASYRMALQNGMQCP